jgi:hypothetical protein
MKSIAFLLSAIGIVFLGNHVVAQQVTSANYPVTKSTMTGQPRSGEKKCEYFFYTTILGPSDPRVAFTFVLPDGKTKDEMPSVKDLVIVTDSQQDAPVVREIELTDAGHQQYELRMNSATYAAEATCLAGVARK